jgi:hypothetical protein
VSVKYAYKFRLYPTKDQQVLLAKHFGCSRYLYNYFLARRKQEYLSTGRSTNYARDCKELTELKKTLPWLTEVGSQSLQQAIKNLDAAYGNFYEKRAAFPKFKNKDGLEQFDYVVANPPFSYRWEPTEAMGEDFRFKSYGLAPKSAADFAFLLHGFHFLSKEGTMAIILPHGVLFRSGAEERIRRKLLEDGNIDTIIGLPANLFFSTVPSTLVLWPYFPESMAAREGQHCGVVTNDWV